MNSLITVESINKKLGFDFMEYGQYPEDHEFFEDDSPEATYNPFSALTSEEQDFVFNYILKHRYGITEGGFNN